MKKLTLIISAVVILTLACFSGCTKSYTSIDWKFNQIVSVQVNENIDQEIIDDMYTEYGVDSIQALNEYLFNSYTESNEFGDCYVDFYKKNYAHTYDTIGEREGTWYVVELEENKGIFSLLTEGNPTTFDEVDVSSLLYQIFTFNPDSNTLHLEIYYVNQFIVLEFVAK